MRRSKSRATSAPDDYEEPTQLKLVATAAIDGELLRVMEVLVFKVRGKQQMLARAYADERALPPAYVAALRCARARLTRLLDGQLIAARIDRLELHASRLPEAQLLAQLVDVLLDRALDKAGLDSPYRRSDLLA